MIGKLGIASHFLDVKSWNDRDIDQPRGYWLGVFVGNDDEGCKTGKDRIRSLTGFREVPNHQKLVHDGLKLFKSVLKSV